MPVHVGRGLVREHIHVTTFVCGGAVSAVRHGSTMLKNKTIKLLAHFIFGHLTSEKPIVQTVCIVKCKFTVLTIGV